MRLNFYSLSVLQPGHYITLIWLNYNTVISDKGNAVHDVLLWVLLHVKVVYLSVTMTM